MVLARGKEPPARCSAILLEAAADATLGEKLRGEALARVPDAKARCDAALTLGEGGLFAATSVLRDAVAEVGDEALDALRLLAAASTSSNVRGAASFHVGQEESRAAKKRARAKPARVVGA
jgi:hypothetical protein